MNPIADAVRVMPLLLTYAPKEPRVILHYYLPLDVGTLADLGLPKDLSASEAERLCALVMSLAVPEAWH